MLEDLDQREIDALGKEYTDMKQDIDNIILSRMKNATIPVGGVGEISLIETIDNRTETSSLDTVASHRVIDISQLCPCGSGKKIGECHGMYTRQKRRR